MTQNYKYGGVPSEECEVTVTIDKESGIARICSTWNVYSRKLEKRYGPPVKYQEREGFVTVAFWKVPFRVIRFASLVKRVATIRKDGLFPPVTTTGRPVLAKETSSR
jgi:hypothetical protein